jgi:enoyl-CoA hydratase/carnithine racemase
VTEICDLKRCVTHVFVLCSSFDPYDCTCSTSYQLSYLLFCGLYSDFILALSTFPKPIVAAVNGPAVGVGVAVLALCDIVYASDKASFYCPYARLCQTPEGCSSYTLPKIMGIAMVRRFGVFVSAVSLMS